MSKYVTYSARTGLAKTGNTKRKTFAGILASVGAMAVMAVPAFAAGNSIPGGERYDNNPGRQQATEVGAQCGTGAGSGAFGYLGKDNNMAGGADGQQTGLNNSAICGNRQSN